MAVGDLVIGLDCSTTACKAVLWNRHGIPLSSGRAALPIQKPRPSWHEQPAEAWWTSTVTALRQATKHVDPRHLAAICIAPQRETFAITNQSGYPLHPALLWMDERCRSLLPEIDAIYGKDRIHRETGKPLSANLTLGKLFWLSRNLPELCTGSPRVNDVHAYLANRFTGRFVTSWGCADPTGLFNMQQNCWNSDLIEVSGFHLDQFPEAVPPGTIVGTILPRAAEECGLPPGIPLIAGLGDGQSAGLGVNVTQPGEAYLNLGTAVVSGTFSQEYLFDPAFRTMYSGIQDAYILETVLLGGTYTINWFMEEFASRHGSRPISETDIEKEAMLVPPGSNGLVLVPYWNSAMNPYWDAAASGIITGWRGIHGLPHLYRAILEGIALEQRLHTTGVENALGKKIDKFIAVGGGSHSLFWCQIIADVTRRRVVRADTPEATALGAGILAAAACGWYPDIITAAQAMTRLAPVEFDPDPARAEFYDKLFDEVYKNLYPALQSFLTRLADLASPNLS